MYVDNFLEIKISFGDFICCGGGSCGIRGKREAMKTAISASGAKYFIFVGAENPSALADGMNATH